MNKCMILGNAVRDAELREVENGLKVLNFTVAVKRRGKKNGHPETDYFRCVEFGERAALHAPWILKGTKCAVMGRVAVETYEAKDKTVKANLTLFVEELETVRTGNATETPSTAETQETPVTAMEQMGFVAVQDDDDLPF